MAANRPNKDELYRMGVEAAKKGQKQPARMMFQQVLQLDGRDDRAMMWLAKLAVKPEERAQWLQRVLKVKPNHDAAKKALHKLETRDEAARNRLMLRVGSAIYVVAVIIISIFSIVIFS